MFDPDKGIGGISRFQLESKDQRAGQFFSLTSQHCRWPKCSAELRLGAKMGRGQRTEVRVLATDGAGLTQKRANRAEVALTILAVGEQKGGEGRCQGKEGTNFGSKQKYLSAEYQIEFLHSEH